MNAANRTIELRYGESTHDALVAGNIVQITPQIAGTVVSVGADDNQFVRVGQTLVELDDAEARIAVERAEAARDAAQHELGASRARTGRTTVTTRPDLRSAAAQVHEAYLQLARTKLVASVSGFVAKRNVELGQRVSPGLPLMEIVPLDEIWVEARFKEPQLATIRVGQPVTLRADLYGNSVTYHGRVAGLSAATVTSSASLSPQYATDSCINGAPRLPVRITLYSREVAAHPLRLGHSVTVFVDTPGSTATSQRC